jgi:hypothetical protein
MTYKQPVPLSIRPKSAVKGSCRNKYVIVSVAVNLPKNFLERIDAGNSCLQSLSLSV